MPDKSKKRIRLVSIIYWTLLLYIVAALVWWFISLEKQNRQMADMRETQLDVATNQQQNPALYHAAQARIENDYKRNSIKYIGEGSIFLLLTLVGAWFVYIAIRRQFRLQLQQQHFMMAVTHELKTPISVARLNLETIGKHELDRTQQKKLLQMTLDEMDRLNNLTNNILVSSQLEGGEYGLSKEELDFSDLFHDTVQELSHRFHDRTIREETTPGLEMKGDQLLLKLMISNLVENAIKYSPKEKSITCRLFAQGNNIHIQVIDEGSGIPGVEKKNIFLKFYRIGNEATRKSQGTGLGLYLCRRIAADHQGSISVSSGEKGGSVFEVLLPSA
jgi:signal transduction histidine kinase